MKRIVLFAGIGIVVVAAAAIYFVGSRLDSLIEAAIEHYGSEIAGVPVRVGSVSIKLADGRGTIRGLRVGNPPGFASGDAFRFDEITLEVDPKSVAATPFVVDQLRILAPEANFEVKADGESNFDVIRKNIDRYSGPSAQSDPKQQGEAAQAGEDLRIRIRHLDFQDGTVTADVSALAKEQEPLFVDMPGLDMKNVGGERGGTPAEIGEKVLGAYTAAVGRTVAASQAQRQIEKAVGGEAGRAAGKLVRDIFE